MIFITVPAFIRTSETLQSLPTWALKSPEPRDSHCIQGVDLRVYGDTAFMSLENG